MRAITILLFSCFATTLLAQQPDTIYISARSNLPAYTKDVLQLGTKYVVQATGGISYWRDSVPPGESDADAAFVFHLPYIPGFATDTIDSVNRSITWNAGFMYLPCDGSTCSSVPPAWGCGNDNFNYHSMSVLDRKEFFLDKDYFSMNGEEFCARNGADMSRHSYVEGITGNGQRAAFQFHDGDGDYVHNAGTLQVIVTRMEPIATIGQDTIDFGIVHPSSVVKPIGDTIRSSGSPFFPGCMNASSGLRITLDSITGDVDEFSFSGLTLYQEVDLAQGLTLPFICKFSASFDKAYQAILWFSSNDPQAPLIKIYVNGIGAEGVLNYTDTLDFGDVVVDSVKQLPLHIENIGNAILHVQRFELSETDTAFSCADTSALDLAVGSSASRAIVFHPSLLGITYRYMWIDYDFDYFTAKITLKGNGVSRVGIDASAVPVMSTMNVSVSPNPCTTHAALHIDRGPSITHTTTVVRLLDMLGREIRTVFHGELPINGIVNNIDVLNLAAGTYVLDAATSDGQRCHAMISVAPR